MIRRACTAFLTVITLVLTLSPAVTAAQSRGGSSGSGAPPMRVMTPFEEFVERLKLDDKTQLPAVQNLLNEGARTAAPLVTEMAVLRQQLLNTHIADKAVDAAAAAAAYQLVAARMTGTEAATFSQVFALLKPNQVSRASEAFQIMAGFFVPPVNVGRAGRGPTGVTLGRLEIIETLFTLKSDQKKDVKMWFDETQKAADETRKGLASTRAALATALQTGKSQDEIAAATKAYAVHVTAMTDAEMAAFARLIKRLDPEQRTNQAAINTTFGLMRGMFASKNWNAVPDGRAY